MVKHALFVIATVALLGCMKQAQQVMGPDPEQVGTYSCREIVENCDSQCSDPICVNKCSEQGTREAQPQHAALVDCAQRTSCMDRDCMEQNCPQEIQTCMGPSAEEQSQQPPMDTKESQTTSGQ